MGFSIADLRALIRTFTMPAIRLPEIGGVKLRLRPVYAVLMLIIVMAGFYYFGVRGAEFRRRSFESRAYMRFRLRVSRLGGDVTEYTTAGEVYREAVNRGLDPARAGAFIRLYEHARFGGRGLDPEEQKSFEGFLDDLISTGRTSVHGRDKTP